MAEVNKAHLLGGTAIKPVERHGWERIRYILHNPETGTFLSRTPKSWALITLFYLVYYTFLACFWALMLLVFFQTINYDKPKWIAEQSIIGTSPGLGLRPGQTDKLVDSSMIFYNKDKEEDTDLVAGWGGWAARAREFLDTYEGKPGKDCSPVNRASEEKGEVCKFQLSSLGACNRNNSGYPEGEPCIYLKLNRIIGVANEFYNDPNDLPEEMPESLKKHIAAQADKNQVWVNCRGENPADEENMGDLIYYPPSRGFPSYYFPYMNQPNYTSPIVAVQFKNPAYGQLLHIECRAWAKNIRYDKRDRMGISHFELYILDNKMSSSVHGES